jgi:DAK2 domain fusion protein YloV
MGTPQMGRKVVSLDGEAFRLLVAAGARCLERHVDEINALNVFPVPDGDTGINMLLTLRAAEATPELPPYEAVSVARVSSAMARAALMGARGNSGVIFAQFMRGLASGLDACTRCDGPAMAQALMVAATSAYKAVSEPAEGTMLTVMWAAAEASAEGPKDLPSMWEAAYQAAIEALAHTPEQLPVLKEAGVVDAGGQGVVAFMAGALAFMNGQEEASVEITAPVGEVMATTSVSREFLEHTEAEQYGYCTQFVVQGEAMDLEDVRDQISALGWSAVVVGDDTVIKVHVHARDPGALLSVGASVGSLDQVKVENMDVMHQEFMARQGYVGASRAVAVVAVAPGQGLAQVMRDLGAVVVPGGQSMNPSAQQLVDAVQRASVERVVLLPNNPNIILTARQAAQLSGTPCVVVPSRTVPQGIAALLAFNPDLDADANVEAMSRALAGVRSGEVTTAVRSSSIGGVKVSAGQAIAFLDGDLAASASTAEQAALELIERAGLEPEVLVTLYWGGDATYATAASIAAEVGHRWPESEVEVVEGGQPHYHYLISLE